MNRLLTILCAAFVAIAPLSAQDEDVSYPAPLGAEFTAKFPYSMAGQLIFTSGDSDYQGSGTVVFKRSVLTAAHNLWDADNGWSTDVEFNRAREGVRIAHTGYAARIFVLGGYQGVASRFGADSVRALAYDIGGLRFSRPLANGSFAGWRADPRLLVGDTYNIALGYGANYHTGDDLLFVEPGRSFYRSYTSFLENDSLTFEGGMSGGPVFASMPNGELRIVAVIVAGSDDPPSGGVRALNASSSGFLSTFLRY